MAGARGHGMKNEDFGKPIVAFTQWGEPSDSAKTLPMSLIGTKRTWPVRLTMFAPGWIVLQNSKNGLQRFFREKSNQATIADRCVLKRATEVAGEFIASCCGPPNDYSIAAPTARRICVQRSKKSFATLSP